MGNRSTSKVRKADGIRQVSPVRSLDFRTTVIKQLAAFGRGFKA
jgi:hypothetical protein